MICGICGDSEDDVRQCAQCGLKTCDTCRPVQNACPGCGASVAENAKCSVSGGCGSGSQEEP